jgi:hypothetical protein
VGLVINGWRPTGTTERNARKLSLIFLRQRDKPMPAELPHPTAVDTTVVTPGILLQWLRSNGGEWLGLVSYQLPFADGRKKTVYLERQLVPAYALRPRKYGRSSAAWPMTPMPAGLTVAVRTQNLCGARG